MAYESVTTGTVILDNAQSTGAVTLAAGRLELPHGGFHGSLLVTAEAAFATVGEVSAPNVNQGVIEAISGTLTFSSDLSGSGSYRGISPSSPAAPSRWDSAEVLVHETVEMRHCAAGEATDSAPMRPPYSDIMPLNRSSPEFGL